MYSVVQLVLTCGIKPLDELLDGLQVGNLVLIDGGLSALRLSHLFSVRSQLPAEKGGLGSPVIWLDGGNTFNLYSITEFSEDLGLDPERVLKGIYISRAFTCYQMSSLVLEKLWDAVKKFKSRFVVISDLPHLYLESDIPRREVAKAFMPVVEELRASPKREEVLILTTSLEYPFAGQEVQVQNILASNADVVLRVRERRGGIEVKLEKHPSRKAKKVVLGVEVLGVVPLDEFAGGVVDG